MSQTKKTERAVVNIPIAMHQQMRIIAAQKDTSVSKLVAAALRKMYRLTENGAAR